MQVHTLFEQERRHRVQLQCSAIEKKNLPTLYSVFPSSISFCSRIRRISGFEVAIAHAAFPAS